MRLLARVTPIIGLIILMAVVGQVATLPTKAQSAIALYPVPTPRSLPYVGIVTGPDGALWFTEAAGRIGRSTTIGLITEYNVNAIQPRDIVVGPDGALWFTDNVGLSIGRITTDGASTTYQIPMQGTDPERIVAGPDGALWFTGGGRTIGRVTTSGIFSLYSTPTLGSPKGIAVGPDGALWFTYENAAKIGRITTSGEISEFSDVSGRGITAGPDGAMWFTSSCGIGRITMAGAVTEFSIPNTVRCGMWDITAGPDDALWFAGTSDNRIGRITTDGVVTQFFLSTFFSGTGPAGITPGPDGAMWFTHYDANLIGRIPLTFTPTPEVIVSTSGTGITDGGSFSFGSTLAGQPVSKSFTVANTGSGVLTLSNLSVPPGFSIEANFGSTSVAPGSSTTFRVRLDGTSAGSPSGTLQFSNNDADENPFHFTISGTVTPAADLSVTLTDSPDPSRVGQDVTLTVTVRNNGPSAATGVTLTETFPSGANVLSVTPSQGSCTQGGSALTCSLGALANSSSATVVIVERLGRAGTYVNTATVTVSGTESDPSTANNTVSENSTVATVSDLARLNVAVQGQGGVTSNPSGINCPPQCVSFYAPGTSVSLTAIPDSGWVLVGWEGACQGTGGCTVSVTTDVQVRAVFRRQ